MTVPFSSPLLSRGFKNLGKKEEGPLGRDLFQEEGRLENSTVGGTLSRVRTNIVNKITIFLNRHSGFSGVNQDPLAIQVLLKVENLRVHRVYAD